jgi:hypothetical protein
MFNRIEKIPALAFDGLVAGVTVPAAAAPLHTGSKGGQFFRLEGAYGYASDHMTPRLSDGAYKSGVFVGQNADPRIRLELRRDSWYQDHNR